MNIIILLVLLLKPEDGPPLMAVLDDFDTMPKCLAVIKELEKTSPERAAKLGCLQVVKANRTGEKLKEVSDE